MLSRWDVLMVTTWQKCLFLIKFTTNFQQQNKIEPKTKYNPSHSPYHKYNFIVIQNMNIFSNINSSNCSCFQFPIHWTIIFYKKIKMKNLWNLFQIFCILENKFITPLTLVRRMMNLCLFQYVYIKVQFKYWIKLYLQKTHWMMSGVQQMYWLNTIDYFIAMLLMVSFAEIVFISKYDRRQQFAITESIFSHVMFI